MSYLIRCEGDALSGAGPVGKYLKTYDADGRRGRGVATWTADPDQAMQFETKEDAIKTWMRQSARWPLRPDGRPNRPLTAFSVSIGQPESFSPATEAAP